MNINMNIIGYIGMIFVASSFLFKNILWVRKVNVIGAILSAYYGFITKTYPTMILNIILICINMCYLIKADIKRKEK